MDKWDLVLILISCVFIVWDGGYPVRRAYERNLNNTGSCHGASTILGGALPIVKAYTYNGQFNKLQPSIDITADNPVVAISTAEGISDIKSGELISDIVIMANRVASYISYAVVSVKSNLFESDSVETIKDISWIKELENEFEINTIYINSRSTSNGLYTNWDNDKTYDNINHGDQAENERVNTEGATIRNVYSYIADTFSSVAYQIHTAAYTGYCKLTLFSKKENKLSGNSQSEWKIENDRIIIHESTVVHETYSDKLISFVFICVSAYLVGYYYLFDDDWNDNIQTEVHSVVIDEPNEADIRDTYGDVLVWFLWSVVIIYLIYDIFHKIQHYKAQLTLNQASRYISTSTATDFTTPQEYERIIAELKEVISDLENKNRLLDRLIVVADSENLVNKETLQKMYMKIQTGLAYVTRDD